MQSTESILELSDSWQLTRFTEAPSLSPSMLSLAVIPDDYSKGYAGSKLPIYIWTNKKLQSSSSAAKLANLTGRVFDQVSDFFTDELQLKQMNVLMLEDFNGTQSFGTVFLGLENWKNADDTHKTFEIAKQMIRQWIGGLTTIGSKEELCFQVKFSCFLN